MCHHNSLSYLKKSDESGSPIFRNLSPLSDNFESQLREKKNGL